MKYFSLTVFCASILSLASANAGTLQPRYKKVLSGMAEAFEQDLVNRLTPSVLTKFSQLSAVAYEYLDFAKGVNVPYVEQQQLNVLMLENELKKKETFLTDLVTCEKQGNVEACIPELKHKLEQYFGETPKENYYFGWVNYLNTTILGLKTKLNLNAKRDAVLAAYQNSTIFQVHGSFNGCTMEKVFYRNQVESSGFI